MVTTIGTIHELSAIEAKRTFQYLNCVPVDNLMCKYEQPNCLSLILVNLKPLSYCGVIPHTRTQASSPELTILRSSVKASPYTPPK